MRKKQSKKWIIRDLEKNVYCRIGISKIDGVGVIAIRDIPKGINPFGGVPQNKYTKVDAEKVLKNKKIHPEVIKMVKDFYSIIDGKIYFPDVSLNAINISFFMNTSKNANVGTENGETFRTKWKIKKGEELTVDYDKFSDRWD
ncbi:MAG: SET domain-containing protein [Patescibacteria group bacterium]